MYRLKSNKGFTLIELSIVIVIIGLIVAGIVGGQALVQQAKLRSVASDYNKYVLAINAFKLEYDAIPGDFARATDYGLGNRGNGDDRIRPWHTEPFFAWGHLANAGLLPAQYEGRRAPVGLFTPYRSHVIGYNIPQSSYAKDVSATFYFTEPGNCPQTSGNIWRSSCSKSYRLWQA